MAKYDVFISYSRKDISVANRLCEALDREGISYWIDRNIHGSANFLSEITHYIRSCKVVVFIASPHSAQSEWTQKEILYALKHKKEIIPYRIGNFHFEDNDELDFVFTNVQWIESEAAVVSALKKLGCTCGLITPKPTPTPKPPRPSINWNKLIKNGVIAALAVAIIALFVSILTPDTTVTPMPDADTVAVAENEKSETPLIELSKEYEAYEARRSALKTYKVGDYYNDGVKEGVVFEVSADGKHGKIVSMTQSTKALIWSSDEAEQKRVIEADSKTDGAYNMIKVKAIAGWKSKYPAFKWCADLGEGWYLPAIDELKKFTLDGATYDAVNRTLKAKGVAKLRGWCWSSTEYDSQWGSGEFCAYYVNMTDGYADGSAKYDDCYVRAVSAF